MVLGKVAESGVAHFLASGRTFNPHRIGRYLYSTPPEDMSLLELTRRHHEVYSIPRILIEALAVDPIKAAELARYHVKVLARRKEETAALTAASVLRKVQHAKHNVAMSLGLPREISDEEYEEWRQAKVKAEEAHQQAKKARQDASSGTAGGENMDVVWPTTRGSW